jgi:hypothetical protein
MQRTILTGLAFAVCFSLNCFAQGPAAVLCVQDLESLPGFLLANDAGARDHLAQFGQKYFDDALAEAKSAALQIRGNASCSPVISKYLRAWRRGHLRVEDITTAPAAAAPARSAEDTAAAPPKNAPTIEVLSAKTLRLTLKTFEPWNRDALIALIQDRREDLEGHPNWIVDVRGNAGGSDGSYAPLLPWLMPDGFAHASAPILATPANIEGWTRKLRTLRSRRHAVREVPERFDGTDAQSSIGNVRRGGRRRCDFLRARGAAGTTSAFACGDSRRRPLRKLLRGICAGGAAELQRETHRTAHARVAGLREPGAVRFAIGETTAFLRHIAIHENPRFDGGRGGNPAGYLPACRGGG